MADEAKKIILLHRLLKKYLPVDDIVYLLIDFLEQNLWEDDLNREFDGKTMHSYSSFESFLDEYSQENINCYICCNLSLGKCEIFFYDCNNILISVVIDLGEHEKVVTLLKSWKLYRGTLALPPLTPSPCF
jgi:hypothetical protein